MKLCELKWGVGGGGTFSIVMIKQRAYEVMKLCELKFWGVGGHSPVMIKQRAYEVMNKVDKLCEL